MIRGKIVTISGPVVDCEFPTGKLPKIREALTVPVNGTERTMEVAQHIGGGTVRCIMLAESENLARGMEVTAKGTGIQVPVGPCTLGRMFDVLGRPIDGKGEIRSGKFTEKRLILRINGRLQKFWKRESR